MKLRLKIKKMEEDAIIPKYQTKFSSGFDLHAYTNNKTIVIPPLGYEFIRTGLCFEVPPEYELQVRSRSGLAKKNGIQVHFGTIDSDYRGEIGVIVFNFGKEEFVINQNDRIAQGVLAPVVTARFVEVDKLSESDRGTGGFGSTGVK
ncbi:dUTP diphosphatase [Bacillus sp. FSL M7-0884]|uniref:dUTP diphosphatase n=1 Tax=Bacillus sp. FSL M7-0884 TaxID=2921537 RepID=UPI0030FBEC2E